jgi:hypothetical protein
VTVKAGGDNADDAFVVLGAVLLKVVAEVANAEGQDEPPPELQPDRVGQKARMLASEAAPARELKRLQRDRRYNLKNMLAIR